MNLRRYLIIYGFTVLLLLFLIGAINLVVDPYGRVRWIDKPWFNQLKMRPGQTHGRGRPWPCNNAITMY